MTEDCPESREIFANIAFDPDLWVVIPSHWGPETWAGPQRWAEDMAQLLWAGLEAGPDGIRRSEIELASHADFYGGPKPDVPFEVLTYLHLPHPATLALPVQVWVDDLNGLTAGQGAEVDDPSAVEAPIVEAFTTEHLGAGLRALRYRQYDTSPDGESGPLALYAVLRYAFEIPTEDAVLIVNATDTDLGRMTQAIDDIDTFVRQIRWAHEPQDLLEAP